MSLHVGSRTSIQDCVLTTSSFLHAENSRAPLKLTQSMLSRIMSYHQVTPRYLEFLFLFGKVSGAHDLRYSGFREQTNLKLSVPEYYMPDLDRSGQIYQLCFNLKTVDSLLPPDTPVNDQQWQIRQAAILHQFDAATGTALWIITKGGLELKNGIEEILGKNGRPEDKSFGTPTECFRSSLAIHSLLAHWAVDNWRWYTGYLEVKVDREVSREWIIHNLWY